MKVHVHKILDQGTHVHHKMTKGDLSIYVVVPYENEERHKLARLIDEIENLRETIQNLFP